MCCYIVCTGTEGIQCPCRCLLKRKGSFIRTQMNSYFYSNYIPLINQIKYVGKNQKYVRQGRGSTRLKGIGNGVAYVRTYP